MQTTADRAGDGLPGWFSVPSSILGRNSGKPNRSREDMSEQPQHPGGRRSASEWIQDLRRNLLSFWTDEAVLIYRRSAQGQHRFRIHAIEGVLFLREVVRESLRNQILTRAASLAYTTLLSLVPLVVAFSYVIRNYFARLFPTSGPSSTRS